MNSIPTSRRFFLVSCCHGASVVLASFLLVGACLPAQAALIDVTSTFSGSHTATAGQATAAIYGTTINWPGVDWSVQGEETIIITFTAGAGNSFVWSAVPEIEQPQPYAIFVIGFETGNTLDFTDQAMNFGTWTFENPTGDTPSATPALGSLSGPGGDYQSFSYANNTFSTTVGGTFTSATFEGVVPASFATNFSAADITPYFSITAGANPKEASGSFASISVVPEPSSLALVAIGFGCLTLRTRRNRE